MSQEKLIKTIRDEQGNYFEQYEVFTPLTEEEKKDMFVELEGEYLDLPLFKKRKENRPLNKASFMSNLNSMIEINNGQVKNLYDLDEEIKNKTIERDELFDTNDSLYNKIFTMLELLTEEEKQDIDFDVYEPEEDEEEDEEDEE